MTLAIADIDIVVLAGGLGTRLRPVVSDRPKVLAPVRDRPFLDLLLTWLERQGARRVILALGHRATQVEAHLRSTPSSLEISIRVENEPLGTGGAVVNCRDLIRSDPFMVMNGDTFLDVDLAAFAADFDEEARHGGAALVSTKVENAARYGRLDLDEHGRILRFVEKNESAVGPAWINGGIYLLSQALLERLASQRRSSLERDLLERLPPGGIKTFAASGRFVDIGTPESLAIAGEIILGPDPDGGLI